MIPRRIPDDFRFKIRTSGSMTLIFTKTLEETGLPMVQYANTATEKDKLLDSMQWDRILLAWNGNYRTDVFDLTPEDLEKHYQ